MSENVPNPTENIHKPQNRKSQKILGSRGPRCKRAKKRQENKAKLLYFTIFHIKRRSSEKKCVFLKKRQGFSLKMQLFLQKYNKTNGFSTFLSENTIKTLLFATFRSKIQKKGSKIKVWHFFNI